jgi:hypothetical protein
MLEYILLGTALHGNTTAMSDAATAKTHALNASGTADRLELRLAALELTVETLMRMLLESDTFSEQGFFKRLQQVDAEDGVVDGRRDVMRMRRECPKCHKISSATNARCMWCSEPIHYVKPQPLK